MVLKGETSVSPTVLPEALVAALIGGEGVGGRLGLTAQGGESRRRRACVAIRGCLSGLSTPRRPLG